MDHSSDSAARVIDKLRNDFESVFSTAEIEQMVSGSIELLNQIRSGPARKDEIERFARTRLQAQGKVEGTLYASLPSVVFVCVHNAGRSQMSAGWARHLAEDRLLVFSGGSAPAGSINPVAVEAMAEVGIDISGYSPAPFTDEIIQASDSVITMGCGDACPFFPNKRYLDWDLPDPQGASLEDVRLVRDEIGHRVEQLLAEVAVL